jgi:hypothetical protein
MKKELTLEEIHEELLEQKGLYYKMHQAQSLTLS